MISDAVLSGALWIFSACAPNDPSKGIRPAPPAILAGIAEQESGYDPDAIFDNTPTPGYPHGRSHYPGNPNAAVDLAVSLLGQGHQIDVGLLGIDYTTWERHKVPLVAAFDECANTRISSEVLMGDYDGAIAHGYRGVDAWTAALADYNSGSWTSVVGYNYAQSVLANVKALLPRIVAIEGRRPPLEITASLVTLPASSRTSPPVTGSIPRSAPQPTTTPNSAAYAHALAIAHARQAAAAKAYRAIEQAAKTVASGGKP